eukprot:Gb_03487 [translate_table: standard]
MVSKKKYIYTIDDDFFVIKDPAGINALEKHIKNPLCPSTPFFFNTLYDPYREGAYFICGYPFSLRYGTLIAVCHGLWMNIPNYDDLSHLVKSLEHNTYNMWAEWCIKVICDHLGLGVKIGFPYI